MKKASDFVAGFFTFVFFMGTAGLFLYRKNRRAHAGLCLLTCMSVLCITLSP